MATAGHQLQQRANALIQRIKTLVNDDLKRICKAHGYQVSGTKQILVGRCVEAVNDAVMNGNLRDFEEISYRATHRGHTPPPDFLTAATTAYSPNNVHNFNMSQQRGVGRGLPSSGRPSGVKYFKPSPFYEILETLIPLQDLPEMPQNRHAVRAYLTLKPEVSQQCRNDPNLKIIMYCGLTQHMGPYSLIDVAFPNQIEVKVGDQEVKSNFKGLKNKPGSTKPADITSYVRKYQGQQNVIQVTYALTTKRYAFTIYLVKYHNVDTLVERVKKHNIIREQTVLRAMKEANADPDIAATSIRMSLKDPVSTMRITLPVRSSHCTHNQCFDATCFMQLQEQAPQWSCPVCSKTIPFDSLCVDEYFQKILDATSKSTEKVDIEPDGEWRVINDNEDDEGTGPVNKPRASYDDDFDDDEDLVEVQQPVSKQTNGIKRSHSQVSLSRPTALDTPPLSSREASVAQSALSIQRSNKRPASAVIDLTLSDDEDEQPPRSGKRQQTNRLSSGSNHTNSYHTPTSIPDPPRMQLPQRQGGNSQLTTQQTDNFRPSSNNSSFAPNQALLFTGFRQPSTSPANSSSPNLTFGQPNLSVQHSRPTQSPLPMPQPYTNNNNNHHSNRNSTYSNASDNNNNIFSPSTSVFDTDFNPHQASYSHHQQHQQYGSMHSPALQPPSPQNNNTAGSSSGLRLPPMHPPQAQQYPAFPSPTNAYSTTGMGGGGDGFGGGGWRSDGNEYGYHFNAGSPSG